MQVEDLATLGAGARIDGDIVIVGAGAAGLTVARELANTGLRIVILESGRLAEEPTISALNEVDSVGEPRSEAQRLKRREFHGANSPSWNGDQQRFGVRCRVLGGSTAAWFGKSALFDRLDFEVRPWVEHSGWPIDYEALSPHFDRAADALNLGPNRYDSSLWDLMGGHQPLPRLREELLRPYFWQFARSRVDHLDLLRLGPEFLRLDAPDIRVVINATATEIRTRADGTAFESVDVATIEGVRARVTGRACVLAASGIENPRLLLASKAVHADGVGNAHDLVGRFLMDHPSARVASFGPECRGAINRRFGFYGLRQSDRTHLYVHGLAPSAALQAREGLLNCAAYMMEERSPDDPWDALKRMLKRQSKSPFRDCLAVASSPALLAKGIGRRLVSHHRMPDSIRKPLVDGMVRYFPNFVAHEHMDSGLPHKLDGLHLDAICEQAPNPDSRIDLSQRKDRHGVPLARIDWRVGQDARRALARLAHLISDELEVAGMPRPILADWVAHDRLDEAVIIDMGHSLGTTRMAEDPRRGVVDTHCQVHGVTGLYIAGGSIFPTSGHANPTLMIVALAIRLADRLRQQADRLGEIEPNRAERPPCAA